MYLVGSDDVGGVLLVTLITGGVLLCHYYWRLFLPFLFGVSFSTFLSFVSSVVLVERQWTALVMTALVGLLGGGRLLAPQPQHAHAPLPVEGLKMESIGATKTLLLL